MNFLILMNLTRLKQRPIIAQYYNDIIIESNIRCLFFIIIQLRLSFPIERVLYVFIKILMCYLLQDSSWGVIVAWAYIFGGTIKIAEISLGLCVNF